MSTIVNATINELIAEYHRITRQQIWIHQDDASACFDRIITNNAILSSRKYAIPDNAYKVNCIAQKKTWFIKRNQKIIYSLRVIQTLLLFPSMGEDKDPATVVPFGISLVSHS